MKWLFTLDNYCLFYLSTTSEPEKWRGVIVIAFCFPPPLSSAHTCWQCLKFPAKTINNGLLAPESVHISCSFLHFSPVFLIPVFLILWPPFLPVSWHLMFNSSPLCHYNPFGRSAPCILTFGKKTPSQMVNALALTSHPIDKGRLAHPVANEGQHSCLVIVLLAFPMFLQPCLC